MRPVPLLLTSADGTVRQANPQATALLGTAPTCSELVRAEDGHGRCVCTATCAQAMRPGEQRDHGLVRVRGRGFRLLCSAVGEGRIIVMVPTPGATGTAAASDSPRLSPREREVLQLVARGLTGQRIARRLSITEATVCTHVQHVRDKLGVRTRSQAVARALALGQIE